MPVFSPLGHPSLDSPPREGAGSARPQGRLALDRDMWPVGHRPFAYASRGDEMPGHPEGRTTRTHRVRPSEKIALRVIPGFPPQGPLALDGPPRGGAGSARPQGWYGLDRDISALGPWPFAYAPGGNEMPGHPDGRTTRTHRVRPSEKIAYPGRFPARPSQLGSRIPRRGGLRTPGSMARGHPRRLPDRARVGPSSKGPARAWDHIAKLDLKSTDR